MTEKAKPLEQICLDEGRSLRNNFEEVIFCEGKSVEQIVEILRRIQVRGGNIFGTRVAPLVAKELSEQFQGLEYNPLSRTIQKVQRGPELISGRLCILSAGTSDVPVAEEAFATARFFGVEANRFYDVGVAGLHRLLHRLEEIKEYDVAIVVAGMDGALASVLGGLVNLPIIACPVSIGYGVHFAGLSTLAAMLNSCSEGIAVVNIDNGFGAACAALRILRRIPKKV